jgi:hypothetical protein
MKSFQNKTYTSYLNYMTERNITYTWAHHLTLFWATWIQSTVYHVISLRSLSILYSYLRYDFKRGLLLSGFQTRNLFTALLYVCVPHALPIFSWYFHTNKIRLDVYIKELFRMSFFTLLLVPPHWSKNFPQRPMPDSAQTVFFLYRERRTCPTRIQKQTKL